jgi:predicted dienelactone hydrolase
MSSFRITLFRITLFLIFTMYVSSNTATAQKNPASTLATVGMTTRTFTDATRKNWQNTGPRPLNTVIWYPAATGSPTAPFVATAENTQFFGDPSFGKFFTGFTVAYDAPILPSAQKHPLILLSHGATSLGLSLMWLGAFLAQHGYIVAAVNHHGNTAAGDQILAQGFALVWERPADLSAVLTQLLTDPTFGNQIDPNRIGAVGHSAGGANVIQLAGGIYDANALIAFCNSPESKGDATCEPRDVIKQAIAHIAELKTTDPVVQESFRHEKESHRDPRVKGIVAMAPAIGPGFTQKNLAPIHIPVQIVVGDTDDTAPAATNAIHYAQLIKGAKLTVLPHVGHSTFGSECNELGKKEFPSCQDAPDVDRAAIHAQEDQQILSFFEAIWHHNQ